MKTILFLIGAVTFFGWTDQGGGRIKQAEWLVGTWENQSPRGSMYETWIKLGPYELSGKSYMLQQNDTVVFENIRLVEEHENLFYIPMVKDQNKGLPVRFALKSSANDVLVFENAEHDFPQVISYTNVNADSLVAEISGRKDGQDRKVRFPMKRVK